MNILYRFFTKAFYVDVYNVGTKRKFYVPVITHIIILTILKYCIAYFTNIGYNIYVNSVIALILGCFMGIKRLYYRSIIGTDYDYDIMKENVTMGGERIKHKCHT